MGVTDKIIKEATALAKVRPIAKTDKKENDEIITQELPQITPDMLPKEIRHWVQDVCERIESPIGVGAVTALTIIGNLIGNKVGIRPKAKDDWTVIPNLWGMIIGSPSVKKTPIYSELYKAVAKVEFEEHQKFENDMKAYRIEQDKYSTDKKKRKESEPPLEQPTKPQKKRYATSDGTIEAIAEIIKYNPNGILQTRDELSGFLKMMDKAGKEGDRAFYLEGWNGTNSFSVDRIMRGSTYIPQLTLGVLGNIQPSVLKEYIYEAVQGKRADGFIQRFQLALFVEPIKQNGVDRYPNTTAKDEFFELIKKIVEIEHFRECEDDPYKNVSFYRFENEAQTLFNNWYKDNYEEAQNAPNEALEGHLNKYPKLICSLSLIFHISEIVSSDNNIASVSKENFNRAYKIVEVLKAHAYYLYSTLEREDAQKEEMHDKIEAKIKELHQQSKLPMTFGAISQLIRGAKAKDVEEVSKSVAKVKGKKIISLLASNV